MLLPAVRFDLLFEVAVLVERADADERHAEVAGRFAVVAGENAKAAGIGAQRFVEAEFGGEIDERSALVAGMVFGEPAVVGDDFM